MINIYWSTAVGSNNHIIITIILLILKLVVKSFLPVSVASFLRMKHLGQVRIHCWMRYRDCSFMLETNNVPHCS